MSTQMYMRDVVIQVTKSTRDRLDPKVRFSQETGLKREEGIENLVFAYVRRCGACGWTH